MNYRQISLKAVNLDDSSFIASLRSNPLINKYLSSSSIISVDEQINWLAQNQEKTDDLYYIIYYQNQPTGTISIYNIDHKLKRAEFGRFIALNPVAALTAELLILKHAFNNLKLEEVYCRTIFENMKVWRQHYHFGFEDKEFERLNDGRLLKVQALDRQVYQNFDYNNITHMIDKFIERL